MTSGTAVAKLLPAVVEASMARVPLVVLTADRPPELRERGAPQTIDQVGIFGAQVRWSVDLPLLDGEAETRRHVRSVVGRAVATCASGSPAGPVHLNIAFREPLIPTAGAGAVLTEDGRRATVGPPYVGRSPGDARSAPDAVAELAARLGRGLAAGSSSPARRTTRLCPRRSPASPPRPASRSSPIRSPASARAPTIAATSWRTRTTSSGPDPWRDAHLPDLVVRFGATTTSKPMLTLLTDARPAQVVVDGDRGWSDPAILPTTFVHADATTTATALADALEASGRAAAMRLGARLVRGGPGR